SNWSEAPNPTPAMIAPNARHAVMTNPHASGQIPTSANFSAHSASITTAPTRPTAATSVPMPNPLPSNALRTMLRKESGSLPRDGGTLTYFLRPSQKMKVAMNIRMPGMPNAHAGPQLRSTSGISSEAKNEPKLMIQ